MPDPILRIATRKSPLALWQAHFVCDALLKHWPTLQTTLLPLSTSGDAFLKDKLLTIGGKGLFVKELEEALLDDRADLAVHSIKDVPAVFPAGLGLAAIGARASPFDAFVSLQYDRLDALPHGAVVGTSSLRRQSQLLAMRPDLTIKTLRGNIQTRLQKLADGEYDAIVLAAAGLERMGLGAHIRHQFSIDEMLPACGQGALGIECRVDDITTQQILTVFHDPITALCVETERQVSAQLGGSCHTSLAVYCEPQPHDELALYAQVASADGQQVVRTKAVGHVSHAHSLAERVTQYLRAEGPDLLNISGQK